MLKERIAFVTGGSGAIGSAIVRTMAREGCSVAYSYKSREDKARKIDTEMAASGLNVTSYKLDILDGKAATVLAETIEKDLGPIDILVNNAGTSQIMPFAMINEADWDSIMDVNVKGMFLKKGVIINMSSLAGFRMLEVPVHYATAKAAVSGFTFSLARELGRYNIRVNTVAPGMLTDGVSVNILEKQQQQYKEYSAMSRAGEPSEVAELVAFLASDRSSYITAQTLLIDGGI
jgi:3-oxoacyl-[acyl-carrier protein] reductase